jgi:hypothetical protein
MEIREQLILGLKQVPILERGDWKLIHPIYAVEYTTRKAALIGQVWIPLSQLRGDSDDGNIFVSTWWWNKESLSTKLVKATAS